MTDKKLTDEEIIKSLKFCEDCSANINVDIIDLINRQKSEIEELKDYINRCKSGEEYWVKCLLERPNEAYKKFAERLKNKIIDTPFGINCTIDMVDNLLKEMVGEK